VEAHDGDFTHLLCSEQPSLSLYDIIITGGVSMSLV